MKHILVVEDNDQINQLLTDLLADDYQVTQCYSGTEAKLHVDHQSFDLLLFDLMLPGMTGEELIQYTRTITQTPIVVITAKSEVSTLAEVLELGANDYIAKPFNNIEVQARINRLIQDNGKSQTSQDQSITIGLFHLNPETHQVHIGGKLVKTTAREYQLLKLLAENPEKVFTKANLYEGVWQEPYFGDDNTISVHISRLRRKVSELTDLDIIETVWGVGFKLNRDACQGTGD